MKWIKASERLPEINWMGCIKANHYGHICYEENDLDGLIRIIRNDQGARNHTPFDPEWLDESDPTPGWTDDDMLKAFDTGWKHLTRCGAKNLLKQAKEAKQQKL